MLLLPALTAVCSCRPRRVRVRVSLYWPAFQTALQGDPDLLLLSWSRAGPVVPPQDLLRCTVHDCSCIFEPVWIIERMDESIQTELTLAGSPVCVWIFFLFLFNLGYQKNKYVESSRMGILFYLLLVRLVKFALAFWARLAFEQTVPSIWV